MLESLHVKNLALMKDIEVSFQDHLNILSGETGAGKSILLGSVNLALGSRADASFIRNGEEEAYIELVFSVDKESVREALALLDVRPEENHVIITRKIREKGSLSRINGETVTQKTLHDVSSLLLDVHGQHEHQTLLMEENHLHVLDEYGREYIDPIKRKYQEAYQDYKKKKEKMRAFGDDPDELEKRLDFISYELDEIEQSRVKAGEEKLLSEEFQTLHHSKQIEEGLSEISDVFSDEFVDCVSQAVRKIQGLMKYDASLESIKNALEDLEGVIGDLSKEIQEKLSTVQPDEERLHYLDERLDLLERLKRKYGGSEEEILKTYEKLDREYEELRHFIDTKDEAVEELKTAQHLVVALSKELLAVRKEQALQFDQLMEKSLADLNFLEVHFQTEIVETNRYNMEGASEVRFLISTNPGEPMKPLVKVASGGELSRIMLAIKTIIASSDTIGTMIFDEIDAGISGKTGRMVAEKMAEIAQNHQVICISHLPQIVAMADHHFLIYKEVFGNETVSKISELSEEGSLKELSRLLGTGDYSESAMESARALKREIKNN